MQTKNRGRKKEQAFFIIGNLIVALFAFCFLISLESEVVSGQDADTEIAMMESGGSLDTSGPEPVPLENLLTRNSPTINTVATQASGGVAWTDTPWFKGWTQTKTGQGMIYRSPEGALSSALPGAGAQSILEKFSGIKSITETKSVFYNGQNYAGQAIKSIEGVHYTQLSDGTLLQYNGKEWVKSVGEAGGATPQTPVKNSIANSLMQPGGILNTAMMALMWGGIGAMIGSAAGGNGAKAGFIAGLSGGLVYSIIENGINIGGETILKGLGLGLEGYGLVLGIGTAIAVFILLYSKESQEVVIFNCLLWQAPVGGNDCEKCNTNEDKTGEPCSEYRCRSLGQACQLLNAGTEDEKCAWINPHDTNSPTIEPWEQVLTPGYDYKDVKIRPPGRGMKIIRTGAKDGCVKAFEALEFGVTTDEPAQCKIDYNHTLKYDDMAFFFGESNLYVYNHSQKLRLPGPNAINAASPELKHDGTYTLYVRCQDGNGNYNVDEFAIRFCVDKGPDTTPPKIESTNIGNNMPIKFNQTSVDLEVYVNEPAECKWSREDRSYNDMEQSMICNTNVWEMNNNLVYTCRTTLTALEDRKDNIFYFRCKDQPWANESDRNVNQQSYKYVLKGTEPLNIISVAPNGTIKGSTEVVPVWLEIETSNGYSNGEAICYFSITGNENDFVQFYETNSDLHKQRQDLIAGRYTYYFKCVDLGGNRDNNKTSFIVEVDRQAPIIARAYKENELLKIITTEKSECRYSTQSCNFKFEDGIDMPYANQTEHVAQWQTDKTYYIRCSDVYGNMPLSNECSMIIRPYDVVKQAED